MNRPSRRAVAIGLPAAALSGAAAAKDVNVRGLTTYSESAMVMSVSDDGRSAVTLRFCRFPEVGATWLWCHMVRDGRIWAFTQHDLPCSADRMADRADGDYRTIGVQAALRRKGKGRALEAVSASAQLKFHESASAPLGPGDVAGSLAGVFTPVHVLGAQVLKDREEVYGTFAAKLAAGPERWQHEGVAKWHEQKQTGPRFGPPFCYSWLGGDGMAATTLLVPQGASGGWVFGEAEDALAGMTVQAPGERRVADYRLRSGRRLHGELSAIVRYEIPIYDRRWQGSFVRGEVDGRPVVGVMNDWPGPPDVYAT
jgi:hypothetical protein